MQRDEEGGKEWDADYGVPSTPDGRGLSTKVPVLCSTNHVPRTKNQRSLVTAQGSEGGERLVM